MLAYCQSRQIDATGRSSASDYLAWTEDVERRNGVTAYVRRGIDEVRDSLVVKNTIPNVSAVLMRRPDLSEIELELVTLRNAGDWLVYVHLLERGDVAYFPEPSNYHRRHGGSVTIGQGRVEPDARDAARAAAHPRPASAPARRRAEAGRALQSTYEYLGLHVDGPASYKDHESLRTLTMLAG